MHGYVFQSLLPPLLRHPLRKFIIPCGTGRVRLRRQVTMKLDNFRSRNGFAEGIFRNDFLCRRARGKSGNFGEIGRSCQRKRGSKRESRSEQSLTATAPRAKQTSLP